MASMKYHKDCKRWRVFWHVTMPTGTVDKGSKSFKEDPPDANYLAPWRDKVQRKGISKKSEYPMMK